MLEGRNKSVRKKKTLRQQEGFTDIREWFEKGRKTPKEAQETKEECGSKEPQEKKRMDR